MTSAPCRKRRLPTTRCATTTAPALPEWLNSLEWRNLRVGDSRLSLVFTRQGEMTTFSMTEREGDIRVLMEG